MVKRKSLSNSERIGRYCIKGECLVKKPKFKKKKERKSLVEDEVLKIENQCLCCRNTNFKDTHLTLTFCSPKCLAEWIKKQQWRDVFNDMAIKFILTDKYPKPCVDFNPFSTTHFVCMKSNTIFRINKPFCFICKEYKEVKIISP